MISQAATDSARSQGIISYGIGLTLPQFNSITTGGFTLISILNYNQYIAVSD